MGLDMYAYTRSRGKDATDTTEADGDTATMTATREVAYWRKHPSLHGWMERLAESKNIQYSSFNGVELELTWTDLAELETAVKQNTLPPTEGFFFGDEAADYYRQDDLAFVRAARAELFMGLKVYYNSSW